MFHCFFECLAATLQATHVAVHLLSERQRKQIGQMIVYSGLKSCTVRHTSVSPGQPQNLQSGGKKQRHCCNIGSPLDLNKSVLGSK